MNTFLLPRDDNKNPAPIRIWGGTVRRQPVTGNAVTFAASDRRRFVWLITDTDVRVRFGDADAVTLLAGVWPGLLPANTTLTVSKADTNAVDGFFEIQEQGDDA